MNEYFKIALTAGTTLIGGMLILILNKIFIDSIQEVRKIIGEAAAFVFNSHSLLADVPDPNEEELQTAAAKLQELSAKLRGALNIVPCISLFSYLRIIPCKENILKAAACLSKLSYSYHEPDKSKISKIIAEFYTLLCIDMYGREVD